MDQQTDELKEDMDQRRAAISYTVDEIQNRVSPGHVAARGRYRVRTTLVRWKDNIMGQVEPTDGGMRERAGELGDTVRQTPAAVERYTRGNPIAVGVIAVGAGALIASLLPETRQERKMVERIEPELENAASGMMETGKEMADDLKESAREGMERVKESARSAGDEVKEDARDAGQRLGG